MPDQKTSPARKRWLILCALFGIIVVSAATVYWFAFLNGWTVGKVERLVRSELPSGSTRPEVEAWLKNHSIKHSYLEDVTRNRLDGQTVPQRAGLSDRDLSGMVEGYIGNANVDAIYQGSILVYFFFDREGRLVGHLIYPLVTGRTHLMGWFAPPPSGEPHVEPDKTEEQDPAVAVIKKLGGKVEVDEKKPGKPVVTVTLANREDITDETLVHLKSLTQLTHLWLGSTSVTDEGLVHLKDLTKLQYLYLGGTKVNGSGSTSLEGLSQLQELVLDSTPVTDAGLQELKRLTQLQTLRLRDTKITDIGLAQLKGLTRLQFLDLGKTAVTDAGVQNLQQALPMTKVVR